MFIDIFVSFYTYIYIWCVSSSIRTEQTVAQYLEAKVLFTVDHMG
jgi:hypothetical protein